MTGAGWPRSGPGTSGEPVAASPTNCKAECDQGALRRLRDQIRMLAARARMLDRDLARSIVRRDKLRDRMWGPKGSLFKTSTAMLGLARGRSARQVITKGKKFKDAGDKLAKDMTEWGLAKAEVSEFQRMRDAIDDEMSRLQEAINQAMKKCADCMAARSFV